MKTLDDLYVMARAFGGIPVLSCKQGSPAHLAGVRYGDVLLKLNGVPTPDLASYVRAQDTPLLDVPLVVVRDGVTLELRIVYPDRKPASAESVAEEVVEQQIFRSSATIPKRRLA